MSLRDHSEYQGGGHMPNGVFPKGNDALTPSDKLRLGYTSGQDTDSRAPVDPGVFYGNSYFDPNKKPRVDQARVRREREVYRRESARYRETPR